MEGVEFSARKIWTLLYAPSNSDLPLLLGRFGAECEAAGVHVSNNKSEALFSAAKRMGCPLQVRGEVLLQVEEIQCLVVLIRSEGKM